jgi:hypothetical protein
VSRDRALPLVALVASLLTSCALLVDLHGISDAPPEVTSDDGALPPEGGASDGGTLIKRMTFEQGRLDDPVTGADKVVGAVDVEGAAPLDGLYSARTRSSAAAAYLREDFTGASDLVVSFLLRVEQVPSTRLRIVRIGSGPDAAMELYLTPSATLDVEHVESPPLETKRSYRVELHARGGAGGRAEGSLAPAEGNFGAPFASVPMALPGLVDSLYIGQTIGSGYGVDIVFDDVELAAR